MINNKKGFTLIELLVVISIIGMMSSVVLAAVNNARQSGKVAAGLKFAGYNYRTMGDSLALLWNFDEPSGTVAYDKSGNNYNGTLSNANIRDNDSPGKSLGRSILSNASGELVSNTSISNFPLNYSSGGDFRHTVSIWMKPLSNLSSSQMIPIASNSGCSGFRCINVQFNNASLNIGNTVFSTPTININEWTNLTYTFDGSKYSLYINGQLIDSKNATPFASVSISQIIVGCYISTCTTGWRFNGYLDDAAIYTRAFTVSEVGKLYAQSAPKYGIALK